MKIRKAVIPAAGLGTRFLPATKAQPKEMLPIVDKPTIQYIVEEAISAGIESILIITGRGKRTIEDHFDKSYELESELQRKGNSPLLNMVSDISNLVDVFYVRQKEAKGLGHAIGCARAFIGNEPFAVLLGDDIVVSEKPAIGQLMDVFSEYGKTVLGVQRVDKSTVNKYGIITPGLKSEQYRLHKVIDMVEKPSLASAPSNIAILGRYIITPDIFEILEHQKPGKNGEIQLTDALKTLCNSQGMYAYEFDGKRYDVGDKLGFLKATVEFALGRDDLKEDFKKIFAERYERDIQMSEIRDLSLAPSGELKIEWAQKNMPVLSKIKSEFEKEKPFEGVRISVSIHLEAKTAYLCRTLEAGGATVSVTGSNPLSTQDDVAAALAAGGTNVYAWHDATPEEYQRHISLALTCCPDIVMDDGADLSEALHTRDRDKAINIIGACEETTTGILRLRARERVGTLAFPVIDVNNADCKHLFDNRYGTGQSVWDGIMRTTNLIVAGKTVVIAGYGWCGKGVAMRAKGLGAKVVITEVDPVRAMEAAMDGHSVLTMDEAAETGDIFITVTGCNDVIEGRHFKKMKNGAILANAGHFDVEINLAELKEMAKSIYTARNNITAYKIDGKELYVLAKGRLVNLAAADGHPAEIMDLSFAIQALSLKYLLHNKGRLADKVYDVPKEIDNYVAELKLKAMGINIDSLTDEQRRYMYGARE